jgi:hypothetical protein
MLNLEGGGDGVTVLIQQKQRRVAPTASKRHRVYFPASTSRDE